MYVYIEKIVCVCMYMLKSWKKKDSHFYNCEEQYLIWASYVTLVRNVGMARITF